MRRSSVRQSTVSGAVRGPRISNNSSETASITLSRNSLSQSRDDLAAAREKAGKTEKKKVFVDAEEMKAKIREQTCKPVYNVAVYYHTTGLWQKIARHSTFEQMTLGVIAFNALWISIDTDLNDASVITQASPVFQIAEHFFCFYFSLEWSIRYMSFKRKRDGFRDSWFIFDSILVCMMVLETWAMAFMLLAAGPSGSSSIMGNAGMLRMARLLRLSRMARMARLFRAMPQLLIVIKALIASLRSCVFVFFLLIVITYVFGIALRQLTAGYPVGEELFHNVPKSMYTLWVDGTILDNPHAVTASLWESQPLSAFVFWVYCGFSALLIMNMLIGVLCEVVSAVSGAEKERFNAEYVKCKLQEIIRDSGLDKNGDGQISKAELSCLLEIPKAYEALSDVGVDVFMLVDNIDYIFSRGPDDDEDSEGEDLTFEEFMTLVLELRGTNSATVNDIVDLKKYIKRCNAILRDELKVARATTTQSVSGSLENMNGVHKAKSYRSEGSVTRESSRNAVAPSMTVETLRQELKTIIEQSLIPELSRVCTARQQEMHEELSYLITQVRRQFADPSFPEDVNHEVVFTESASPSMGPPYSEVPFASGGGVWKKAKKGFGMEAHSSRTGSMGFLSPRQVGPARTKMERAQSYGSVGRTLSFEQGNLGRAYSLEQMADGNGNGNGRTHDSSLGPKAGCEQGSRSDQRGDASPCGILI